MEINIHCDCCGEEMQLRTKNSNQFRFEYYAKCENCEEENETSIQRLEERIKELEEELDFKEI